MSKIQGIIKKAKGMIIDGIAASEHIDSSGEVLNVKGCDISAIKDGTATLNYEHKSNSPTDVVGHIIYGRKIYSAEDCEDERQLFYWEKSGVPLIYIVAELLDSDSHQGAKDLAAIFRYYYTRKLPIITRFSVEGSTIERKGNTLVSSIFKCCAVTLKPCNKDATSDVLFDPLAPVKQEEDGISDIVASVNKFSDPSLIKLGGSLDIECVPLILKSENDFDKSQLIELIQKYESSPEFDLNLELQTLGVPESLFQRLWYSVETQKQKLIKFEKLEKALSSLSKDPKSAGDSIIDSELHGVNLHPDAKKMVHGLDLSPSLALAQKHKSTNSEAFWTKNSAGNKLFVKPEAELSNFGDSEKESAYHNLAKDFFGLGKYVATTASVMHPKTGKMHTIVESVDGEHSQDNKNGLPKSQKHINTLNKLGEAGELDKMGLMDYLLGNDDRHQYNYMFSNDDSIKLFDHGLTFNHQPTPPAYEPDYLEKYAKIVKNKGQDFAKQPLHQDAQTWLQNLNPESLKRELTKNSVPPESVQEIHRRLVAMQDSLKSNPQAPKFNVYNAPFGGAQIA